MKLFQIFDRIATHSTSEKDEAAQRLRDLIEGARMDEAETFSQYRQNRKSHARRLAYFEAVQRLAGILDAVEALTGYPLDIYDDGEDGDQ